MILLLILSVTLAFAPFQDLHADELTRAAVAEISSAVELRNARPTKQHALPLAASWSLGEQGKGFDPDFQIARIIRGDYLLPWFELSPPDGLDVNYRYEAAFRKAAELGLPVSFLSTQWDVIVAELLRDAANTQPGQVDLSRFPTPKPLQALSPFSPLNAWYEAGRRWGNHPALRHLEEIYPNPPLVVFVSNNEQQKLTWHELRAAPELVARLGHAPTDSEVRRAVGDGWIARYKALERGFRDALTVPAWKHAAIFVGYDAIGTSALGRWGGWIEYSLITPGRLDPWSSALDGASPSFYVFDWNTTTDFQVMSPQIEAMNLVPILNEAYKLKPKYWFEISVWDGQAPDSPTDKPTYYRKLGQTYGPDRYAGLIQFGMWLLRPRVVREFRDYLATRDRFGAYFDQIISAVGRVHEQPILRRFWQKGRLLANITERHPYEIAVPDDIERYNRWFLLNSDANPNRPWQLDTPIRVYSLAFETGSASKREWLIYAFSPLDDRIDSVLRIPNGPNVTTRATRNGCFSLLRERDVAPTVVAC
jgi:hypothetical protein